MKFNPKIFLLVLSLIQVLPADGCFRVGHYVPSTPQLGPSQGTNGIPPQGTNVVPPQGTNVVPPQGTNVVPPQGTNVLPPQGTNVVPPPGSIGVPQGSVGVPQVSVGGPQGKPGMCPTTLIVNSFSGQCQSDSQCPGIQKCCPLNATGLEKYCAAVFRRRK